jgi:predicted GIY-YIG superfamily endonuclease
MESKHFYIYIITNILNDKWYVGKTYDVSTRWTSHKSSARTNPRGYLHRAIKLWEDPEYRARMKVSQDARYKREREAKSK